MSTAPWQQVLDFWFRPTADGGHDVQRWFSRDDVFDATIRSRFMDLHEAAAHGQCSAWTEHPQGVLALLIVLDQFSRNLFRDSPRAFAQDAQARAVAHHMVERGGDQELAPIERVFVYLPFEHSEESADQRLSVTLFERLEQSVPKTQRGQYAVFSDYARQHAEVIARFGRFPHRNAALGRLSTAQELAFLELPGSSF